MWRMQTISEMFGLCDAGTRPILPRPGLAVRHAGHGTAGIVVCMALWNIYRALFTDSPTI
jgi:hypothetical protein